MIGDAGRLRQILFNLAGNAVKFTEAGAVLIEARAGENGRGLQLIVRDTGAGVPEHARARLFDAFSQVSAADARRDGGVGLGLAIVARLVDAMKGRVCVSSAWGHGAMFVVELPLEAGPQPPAAARVRSRRPLRVALDLPPASRFAIITALANGNAQLTSDTDEADLVILDAALPPAQIEAIARKRRTLVVLRPGDRSRLETFRAMGCAGYLIRPLRAASIVERVGLTLAGAVQPDLRDEQKKPGEAGNVLIADDNAVNALLGAIGADGGRVPRRHCWNRRRGAGKDGGNALFRRLHGYPHAGDGRPRGDAPHPAPRRACSANADRRADGRHRSRTRGPRARGRRLAACLQAD